MHTTIISFYSIITAIILFLEVLSSNVTASLKYELTPTNSPTQTSTGTAITQTQTGNPPATEPNTPTATLIPLPVLTLNFPLPTSTLTTTPTPNNVLSTQVTNNDNHKLLTGLNQRLRVIIIVVSILWILLAAYIVIYLRYFR